MLNFVIDFECEVLTEGFIVTLEYDELSFFFIPNSLLHLNQLTRFFTQNLPY